jgi:hypothetical protein
MGWEQEKDECCLGLEAKDPLQNRRQPTPADAVAAAELPTPAASVKPVAAATRAELTQQLQPTQWYQ